jgi:hypothetical protein
MVRDRGRRNITAEREQHVGLHPHKIGGEIGETLGLPLRRAVFNREVLPFDVAEIAQRATRRLHLRVGLRGTEQQNA